MTLRPRGTWRRLLSVMSAALLLGTLPSASAQSSAGQATLRLPRLVVLPSPDLYVGTATTAPRTLSSGEVLYGCDPYEAAQAHATRCLRFDTLITNVGKGALELRYDGTGAVRTMPAVQRVYREHSGYVDRTAGAFFFDPAHQHFHYANFVAAALWRSDRTGRRLGHHPLRTNEKDGFCLEDLDPYRATAPNAVYTFPAACYPTPQPDGSITQVNGISPGWLDVYDETLSDQSIEVSGLPDGYYRLQITVDPNHSLLLDPGSRTTSWQTVRLCGNAVDRVGVTHHCTTGGARHATQLGQQWRTLCATGWCFNVQRGRLFGVARSR